MSAFNFKTSLCMIFDHFYAEVTLVKLNLINNYPSKLQLVPDNLAKQMLLLQFVTTCGDCVKEQSNFPGQLYIATI